MLAAPIPTRLATSPSPFTHGPNTPSNPTQLELDAVLHPVHTESSLYLNPTPTSVPRRSARNKTVLVLLRDYDCNVIFSTSRISHSSSALPASSDLLGKSLYPLSHFVNYNKFFSSHRQFLASVTTELEPTKFSNTISNPKWRLAMLNEIDALERNVTWVLTLLSPREQALSSK